jgi:hypothetical protein
MDSKKLGANAQKTNDKLAIEFGRALEPASWQCPSHGAILYVEGLKHEHGLGKLIEKL